jgi:hypothetical protein
MANVTPLFVDLRNAAKLLCVKPGEFQELVEGGHLPRARHVGSFERWDVQELQQIIRGEGMDTGECEW